MLAPLAKQTEETILEKRQGEFQKASEALSTTAPGWEEHEDEMNQALSYLKGASLVHDKYPSKLEVLHWMVTRQASGVAEATKRMQNAARNRTVTGQAGKGGVQNIEDQVRKASKRGEAFDIAAKYALSKLQSEGRLVNKEE